MTTADHGYCGAGCPHGARCRVAHPDHPPRHWFRCDICTPVDLTYRLAGSGGYLSVLHGCGHAVGPAVGHRELVEAMLRHRRDCAAKGQGR